MQIAELQAWVQARLPEPFLSQPPEIRAYSDEVLIVLEPDIVPEVKEDQTQHEAELRLIAEQREATRPLRMQLANELQPLLRRPVAWGMRVGNSEMLFTTRSVPVMTRLGRAEREVLDTLVASGVAETRSSALAYTVRAFATQHADWLAEVRQAITQVEEIRSRLKLTRQSGAPVATSVISHVKGGADESQTEGENGDEDL
jgi:hypothetical protein